MALAIAALDLCAQTNPAEDSIFQVPAKNLNLHISMELGRGNNLLIDATDYTAFMQIKNLDSLLRYCYNDISPLKDNFGSPTDVRKIDYLFIDGASKIRIRHTTPSNTGGSTSQELIVIQNLFL